MTRARDALWDELVRVCGADASEMTRSELSYFGKCIKELRELEVSPEDLRRRAAVYKAKWPNIDVTPGGLLKHWSSLKPAPSPYHSVKPQSRIRTNDDDILGDNEETLTPEVLAANRKKLADMMRGVTFGGE